jgi:polysaccharide biosynthesis transport protein
MKNNTEDFDYKKYLQLIIKKKYMFVSVALAIMTGVAITSYILPERFEARCTVFIEKSVISELVKGIAITPSFEDKLRVLAYTLKSRNLLIKVFNDLGLDYDNLTHAQQEKMVRNFQDNTDIKLKDREGLFIVSFADKNPRFARDFANALVRRYVEENISSKRVESYDATKFLGEQITTIKAKLDEIEAKADSFKRENGALLIQNPGTIIAEIGDAQQKIDEIEIKRRHLESMQGLAKKYDPLKTRLAGLQNKQQELGLVYTDNHPEVLETKNEIAAIKEQMESVSARADLGSAPSQEVEKITMELNSLRDIERNQKRIIASKRALLRSIPATRTAFDELEQEKYSQKNMYDQLQARYRQSEVSKQMEIQDKATTFRIVDPAILPTRPFSPQRVKMILLGIAGGLVASFGFLVLRDHLDKSVRNVESLKSLGVQILAVVPTIEDPNELLASRKRDYWFFGIAAACFMLILATVPLELMRYLSIDIFSSAGIKNELRNYLTLK